MESMCIFQAILGQRMAFRNILGPLIRKDSSHCLRIAVTSANLALPVAKTCQSTTQGRKVSKLAHGFVTMADGRRLLL